MFRNRILKVSEIKVDPQVSSLSNWDILVLFSEIRNTTGRGLGEGSVMVFSV